MIFNYLKMWFKVAKKYITFKEILKSIVKWLLCLVIIYFLTSNNIINSIVILLILIVFKLSLKIISFYKELIKNGSFDLILLKPVDPLIGLIIYNRNPGDILILLPVLTFIKLRTYKK